jgi:hypothetical protein
MYPTAGTPVEPRVEIYVNEAWTDISPDVRYADKVQITGGRPDESSRAQQNTCRFTLNNRDGRYSPRNPTGPLYGQIGRNTAVRVSVMQEGTQRFRFHGEIVAWPQSWDKTGTDVWVPIEAAGVLRRLNQGASPLRSALFRGLIRETEHPVIAYWPLEDAVGSFALASALPDAKPMNIDGTPTLAGFDGFGGSLPVPIMANGSATGTVPAYVPNGSTIVRFLLQLAAGETNGKRICNIRATGSGRQWELYYVSATDELGLRAYDEDGAVLGDSGALTFSPMSGEPVQVTVQLFQQGADVDTTVYVGFLDDISFEEDSFTFTNATVGRVTSISLSIGQGAGETAMGHLSLQQPLTDFDGFVDQSSGYNGENPIIRIQRLCAEEGISFQYQSGAVENTTTMGPQTAKTLPDLLQEAVDADMGVLYEPRDQFGLEYRTRASLYHQSAGFVLDYTGSDLFDTPTSTDDDQYSRNDVTVTRDGGSSARSVLESGPLSVLRPPDGIGRYDTALTVNLENDDQLADQAGWRRYLGTVDEPRYPTMTVHLKRDSFTADYGLTAKALLAMPGDRVLIDNMPDFAHPRGIEGLVSQIIQSWTEWFDQFEHVISFNGTPESPYQINVLDSGTLGRADTEGSVLTSALDETTTSVSVTTTSGPVWVDSAAYASEFPFEIMVGGEIMIVTAITGTTSPQTFTVTRSSNEIVKNQLAGTDVRLRYPMIVIL